MNFQRLDRPPSGGGTGPADLILGNNVFAHVPDTNDFVAGLATLVKPADESCWNFPCLRPGGACGIRHDLPRTRVLLHPHRPRALLARHGLEAFDVERLAIHGGSLRLTFGRCGVHDVKPSVPALLSEEATKGVSGVEYYNAFSKRVLGLKESLLDLLKGLRASGHCICAYGASAKRKHPGQFLRSRSRSTRLDRLRGGSQSRETGTADSRQSPSILPVEELKNRPPRHALLLTWNFAEEILAQQQEWRSAGGRFIVPLPEVRVV